MSDLFINQKDLARRWGISPRTLERWRRVDQGPSFVRLGALVMYRRQDVEQFEQRQTRTPSQTGKR
jgi:transposase-like protein